MASCCARTVQKAASRRAKKEATMMAPVACRCSTSNRLDMAAGGRPCRCCVVPGWVLPVGGVALQGGEEVAGHKGAGERGRVR